MIADAMAGLQRWIRTQYWSRRDHVSASRGAADAGLPVVLDAAGKLGTTMVASSGEFTPDLRFNGVATGITYALSDGYYKRVGDVVFVEGKIILSSKGLAVGTAEIYGLPIGAGALSLSGIQIRYVANLTMTGQFIAYITGTVITLGQVTSGTFASLTNTEFANNTRVDFYGAYFA